MKPKNRATIKYLILENAKSKTRTQRIQLYQNLIIFCQQKITEELETLGKNMKATLENSTANPMN